MASMAISIFSVLFSVLMPQKMWYAPNQPLNVTIKSDKAATLELTDFNGKVLQPKGSADVDAGQTVDLKTLFPNTENPGTYVVYAVARGSTLSQAGPPKDFLGTPLVIEVLQDSQNTQLAMVTHVEPLRYAVMNTDSGPITEVFYYASAPHTVDNFLQLASGGYYDGLVFHRIKPGFVIQGGDPLGSFPSPRAGSGGPGYGVDAEFNDKPHIEGVLSMARAEDINSAGSQFFICLDYTQTMQLDHKYTAFGKVVAGMDAVKKIASVKTDPANDRPDQPPVITKVDVLPVTAQNDPYTNLMTGDAK